MAIKIKSLERLSQTYVEQNYIYKDLALDINFLKPTPIGFKTATQGSDLQSSLDFAAIKNSLLNLFNTLPGQRFLFPEYGLDLYQFLFLPVTESTGQIIGERLYRGIQTYEPRVTVQKITVVADTDNSQYLITILIELPALKATTAFEGSLNTKTQSFIFLPTSRNK